MSPDDVLDFWFGTPATDEAALYQQIQRWFNGGSAVDDQIRARFPRLHERAIAGELDGEWGATPCTRRALILVLDQFTRNLGRGTPAAYAGDAKARQLAIAALDRGDHIGLSFVETIFVTTPLEHSEELPLHERGLGVLEKKAALADKQWAPIYDRLLTQPRKYREWIARFGRFPHRNAILGRTSSPEELAFLAASSTNG